MRDIKEKNPERGAALVELAMVLPLLLLILMGIVELGLLFYNQQVLTNASREGARTGIARFDENSDDEFNESDIDAIVVSYCQDRLITFGTVPPPTIVLSPPLVGMNPGDPLTVTVSYDYTFFVPKILKLGTGMELTAETVMSMERVL
jgi:Flp pilus assembly protein TadG